MNLSGRLREDLPSAWVGTIQLAAENTTEGVLLSPTLRRDTLSPAALDIGTPELRAPLPLD